MTHNSNTLSQVLKQAQSARDKGSKILTVFDLDSTLFDVSPRTQYILREFAQIPDIQERFPQEAQKISKIEMNRYLWGIRDGLYHIGITEPETLIKEAFIYWQKYFFHNDYLVHDTPMQGASEFLEKLSKYAEVSYLTGRDVERMGQGTLKQIQRHQFPLKDKSENLVLKPHRSQEDAPFKLNFFKKILEEGKHQEIWFFDNDPRNLNLVHKEIPEIRQVFFKSAHPPELTIPEELPQILHFVAE